MFPYPKRAVWYRRWPSGNRGNFICTFRDDSRKAKLVGRYVERVDKDYGEEKSAPMDVLKETSMGYLSFCSTLDVPAEDVYLDYKLRWDNEQCFSYFKRNVTSSVLHAHAGE